MICPSIEAGRAVVVISPIRDEADHFSRILRCMESQTLRPKLWVLVDDGSTDETPHLIDAAAREHEWIVAVHRENRGRRLLGGGVVHAFREGLENVAVPWDYVAKLDADLEFGPRYLETILEEFERDPKLGSASGKVFRPERGGLVEEFMIDEMVAGQWKLYRRSCFKDIGGLVPAVMWDGIDFHEARRRGWKTRSFRNDELRIVHHRLMGSSDAGVVRGRIRWGRGQWFMGSHPLYLVASAIFRMKERPRFVGGLLIAFGFLSAMLRREPRYSDREFRSDLRSWQMRRLKRLALLGEVR